jgi:hypothetical protein
MACRRYYDGLCQGGPCETCVDGNMSNPTDHIRELTMGKVLRTLTMMIAFVVTFVILWVVDR